MQIKDHFFIVTGASSGIGLATAVALSGRGAKVALPPQANNPGMKTSASDWELVMKVVSFKQPQLFQQAFPSVRRIRSASRTAVCRHNRLRHAN
jgi:short-subunit dehydrogenase involved in D-alanine esterification of teichoic acids